MLRSASFKLAALQTALFLIAFTAAGVAAFSVIRHAEYRAAHAEIEEYEDDISDLLSGQGVAGLAAKASRRQDAGRDFRLEDGAGHVLIGRLPAPPIPVPTPKKFWSAYHAAPSPERPGGQILAYTKPEPGGLRLTVGEYLSVRERQDNGLLIAVIGLAALAAGLGLSAGAIVSHRVLSRVDQMARAIDVYANGERNARVPVGDDWGSDHRHLADTINSMMDRENRLIEGLRQVTSAIAHDLRRPLAHHNQEIATALERSSKAAEYRAALLAASARVDEVLQTFQALLHIAELEAGAPGLVFEPVDVSLVAAKIVEAYRPSAEANGRHLTFTTAGPATVPAEPRILGQLIANLVENALTHTPKGTEVHVSVDGSGPAVVVADNGPGVPGPALSKIFERFYRLDASRSTPGNGLGLSLAAAAMQAFGGVLLAEDAAPGLKIIARFNTKEKR
jgi:signal transduction histidine kinase